MSKVMHVYITSVWPYYTHIQSTKPNAECNSVYSISLYILAHGRLLLLAAVAVGIPRLKIV